MSSKNFMSYGDSETIFTEYASAIKRRLPVFPGTREEFMALSAAERKKYKYFLDNSASVVTGAMLDEVENVTLTFTNNVATVAIADVTEASKIFVFFTNATREAAEAAGITFEAGSGVVTFTAANAPSGTITCDIMYYAKNANLAFPLVPKVLSATLTAGQTTVSFTDASITDGAYFDVLMPLAYSQVCYSAIEITAANTLTLTFPEAQQSDIVVKVRVSKDMSV